MDESGSESQAVWLQSPTSFCPQNLYVIKWVTISSTDLFAENFNPGHLELQNQILKLEQRVHPLNYVNWANSQSEISLERKRKI